MASSLRRPPGTPNAEWDTMRRALPEYRMSDEEFVVLRLLGDGEISASKARELIEDLRHGESIDDQLDAVAQSDRATGS